MQTVTFDSDLSNKRNSIYNTQSAGKVLVRNQSVAHKGTRARRGVVSETTPYVDGAGQGVPASTSYRGVCGRGKGGVSETTSHGGKARLGARAGSTPYMGGG